MGSDTRPNLSEGELSARDETVIGTRISAEDVRLIDLARIHAGYSNRSEFIYAAVMERARAILEQVEAKAS